MVIDNHENISGALKAPVAPTSTIALSSASEKALTELTSKFDAMVLAMNLGMRTGQASLPLSQNTAGNSSGAVPTLSNAREKGLCNFCEMKDRGAVDFQYRRDKCPTFNQLIENGDIHLSERGLIRLAISGTQFQSSKAESCLRIRFLAAYKLLPTTDVELRLVTSLRIIDCEHCVTIITIEILLVNYGGT